MSVATAITSGATFPGTMWIGAAGSEASVSSPAGAPVRVE
jgi:hypothetical protein